MKKKLEELADEELLALFEEVRCCWHYCPCECNHNKDFTLDELREAVLERMGQAQKIVNWLKRDS